MELYVLDKDFNILGIVDNYECLIWERNYYKSGNFSMQTIPNVEQFYLLKKGNILLKRDNSKEAVYIDHRELEENENGIEVLVVKGYSLSEWCNRRITLCNELEKANIETIMKNYVDRHCVNPKEINRKIPYLVNGMNNNLGKVIDYKSHYKQLSEELQALSEVNEIGHRIDLDLINKNYIFEVYEGLDRTVGQEVNSKAVFSTEFENIEKQRYIESDNNYRNMTLIAGAGEGIDRKTVSIGKENTGLDRYELFVDARDISDTETKTRVVVDEVTGESRDEEYEVPIPLETYNKLLEVRGNEKLSECNRIETFDCELLNVNTLKYRVDYDLGDKVSIINKKWGLVLHERITSIEETYTQEGLSVKLTIGNNIPTLVEKIKQKMR